MHQPAGASFTAGVHPPIGENRALWFIFRNEQLLVVKTGETVEIPSDPEQTGWGFPVQQQLFLGLLAATPCWGGRVDPGTEPGAGMDFLDLRTLHDRIAPAQFKAASTAAGLLEWSRTGRYCGVCGTPLSGHEQERSMVCPGCGWTFYPRLSPAVIVLVTRGTDLLLIRAPHFTQGWYSTVAGYIEPGESAEEAVVREIREETGVEVRGVRYFRSQPWPFPNQLMLGFFAQYRSGEIRVDRRELEDARWFSASALPPLPRKISLGRQLIDHYLDGLQSSGKRKKA